MEVKSVLTGSRLVSMPFSDYCEPLINNNFNPENIISTIKNLRKNSGLIYLDIRGGESFFKSEEIYSKGYVHKLSLNQGEDDLYAGLKSSNKRNIKKAKNEGVHIRFSKDYKSIIDFYNLNIITRQRHGIPPQPFKFFKNLYNILVKNELCEVVEAVYENKIIAGCVFLLFGKKVVYKFGASDYKFQNLRPNDLLFWEAIKHYKGLKFEELCFGRTISEHKSLRQFKLGWGVKEFEAPYYRYDLKKKAFISNQSFNYSSPENLGINKYIFKVLPKPVLRAIGTIAYRHIG
jgi:hypothetical protein